MFIVECICGKTKATQETKFTCSGCGRLGVIEWNKERVLTLPSRQPKTDTKEKVAA